MRFPRALIGDLMEFLENSFLFFLRDAGTVVGDFNTDIGSVVEKADLYAWIFTRVFYCVGDEIDEYLHDAVSVSDYHDLVPRQLFRNLR